MPTVSLHDAQTEVARRRVIEGAVALLSDGDDLTYAKVARTAGVSERTVYRYYPARKDLLGAVVTWVNERAGAERACTADEAIKMVRRLYPTFDSIAPVMSEILRARDGLAARLADNDERRAAAEAIVDDAAPGLDPRTRRQIAAVVQLLTSAAAWQALRDYWEMDGSEAADTVAACLTMLLDGARHGASR